MPDQFFLGLQKLVDEKSLPADNIQVLSIGCGFPDAVLTEYKALAAHFGSIHRFSYTGVEVRANQVAEKFAKLTTAFPRIRVINADAEDIDTLQAQSILPNTFHLVILRHPNFAEAEQEKKFKGIVRQVVPYFLVTGGKFLVSILNPCEAIFFNQAQKTLDTFFIKKLYAEDGRRTHSQDVTSWSTVLSGSAPDKMMFCFTNRKNKMAMLMQEYIIDYSVEAAMPAFRKIVEGLGGAFISPNRFTCATEYALDQDPDCKVYGTIRRYLAESAPAAASFGPADLAEDLARAADQALRLS